MSAVGSTPPPEAYASFAPLLARLSDPLQAIIAGHLASFERLIGAVSEPALSTRGEVEGLGGLTTHGDIAQILQSELLLRTEAPLEFLRRVVESETLYLQRQYHDEGLQRVNRLMISIGPGLLGHGRTLALATLFFMARISQERGNLFHWCYMPTGKDAVWFDEISANAIKRFLKAGSYRELTMDDMADAVGIWDRLHPHAPRHAAPMCIDWMIGALPLTVSAMTRPAARYAPNAFAFRLDPPLPGAARGAMLTLRRRGRDQKPVAFSFPPDVQCLSALNRPFAPIAAAAAVAGPDAAGREPLDGWEPVYFTAPNSMSRIVRTADGVLILLAQDRHVFSRRYFIALEGDAKLVGIRLVRDMLSVLIQDQPDGVERLLFCSAALPSSSADSPAVTLRVKAVPCAQLFRKQPAYAVPLLAGAPQQIVFYAANGKPFLLHMEDSAQMRFEPHNRLSPILYSEGRNRIIQTHVRDTDLLRVLRNSGATLTDFALEEAANLSGRRFGMLYSSAHGHLAYSARPNVWTVPPVSTGTGQDAGDQFEVAPYETPIAVRARGGFVEATLWSDARRGGQGTVRNVQFRNGEILPAQRAIALGEDADHIVDVKMTDDGIWAIALDREGRPWRLLAYYRDKKDKKPARAVFHLAKLQQEAIDIDMIGMADV